MGVVLTVNVTGQGLARSLPQEIGRWRRADAVFSVLDERTRMRMAIAGDDVRPASPDLLAMYYSKPFRDDPAPQVVRKRRLIVEATRYCE